MKQTNLSAPGQLSGRMKQILGIETESIGALPRLEGDMVIKLGPDEVMKVFSATLDSDRDAALDLVANVLHKKIRKTIERPHCLPVFEMKQRVSDKG